MTTLYRIYGRIDARDKEGFGSIGPRLLYVGITDEYERRMSQHKEKRWWEDITKITREEFEDRAAAHAAEREAIENEAPLHNKAMNKRPVPSASVPKARKQPAPPDALMGVAEASEYLGVCTKTLRRYVASGDLPAGRIKGSRLIRIRRSDLDALLVPIPTVGRD